MFSKFNLKQLLGIFVILLLIVLGVELFSGKDKKNSSFKSQLVDVKNSDIGSFVVYQKTDPALPITFSKNNEAWSIGKADKTFNASPQAIDAILGAIAKIRADRVVANSKEKWMDYQVTDSLGTRLIIKDNNGKEINDLIIGKFNYTQPQGQNQYQRQQGTMTSFVRETDDKEVYAVDGYLSMMFDRDIKYMRDPIVVSSTYVDWTKLTVTNPADSSFVLEKFDDKWMMNGQSVDSASVVNYLTGIQSLRSDNFYDEPLVAQPERSIIIEGKGLANPIQIDGYTIGTKKIISSSENRNTYFESGADNLFENLFQTIPETE